MKYSCMQSALAGLKNCAIVSTFAFGSANANMISEDVVSDTTIELGIEGFIKPHCTIQFDTPLSQITLTGKAGQYSQSFGVDCNQHLSVEMRSLNGAFLHEKSQFLAHNPGFSDRINYQVDFSVSAPGASVVSARSQDMFENSVSGSIGIIPFKTEGKLHFSWSSDKPPIAGEYGDVIEILVSGDGGMMRGRT